jgi:hypothetical protein
VLSKQAQALPVVEANNKAASGDKGGYDDAVREGGEGAGRAEGAGELPVLRRRPPTYVEAKWVPCFLPLCLKAKRRFACTTCASRLVSYPAPFFYMSSNNLRILACVQHRSLPPLSLSVSIFSPRLHLRSRSARRHQGPRT